TLGDFYDMVLGKKFTDKDARRYGYAGAHDMFEKINSAFMNKERPDPLAEEILLIDIAPVKTKSWAYFNPAEAPKAAFIRDGKPLSPSAYRWHNPKPGDNDNGTPAKQTAKEAGNIEVEEAPAGKPGPQIG